MTHRLYALSASALVTLASLAVVGCDSPGLTSKSAKSAADANAEGAKGKNEVGQATTTGAGLTPLGAASAAGASGIETQGLSVSNEIASACGIAAPASEQSVATQFDFDSAAISEEDRALLQEIARCLSEGALKGRSVSLVGRADPRGEAEYNMTLGESRADSVMRYMVDLGVGRDRMRATSRGELDATGSDEDGWARDRRVDVELAK
jgi:peptidoglycan-associated lipoprotein